MLPGPKHNNPFVKDMFNMFSKNALALDYEVSYWQFEWGRRQSDMCKETLEERIEGRKMYAAYAALSLDELREDILWSGMYRIFFVFSNTFEFNAFFPLQLFISCSYSSHIPKRTQ